MMGRRQKLKGADEFDVVSRYWRGITGWDRGVVKRIKRRMNKRARKEAKAAVRQQA